MSKNITIDNLLTMINDIDPAAGMDYAAMLHRISDEMALIIDHHYQIVHTPTRRTNGRSYVAFNAGHRGQPCPAELAVFDHEGVWDGETGFTALIGNLVGRGKPS